MAGGGPGGRGREEVDRGSRGLGGVSGEVLLKAGLSCWGTGG